MDQPGPGQPPPFEATPYPGTPAPGPGAAATPYPGGPQPGVRRFGPGGVALGLLVGAVVSPGVALMLLFGAARLTGSGPAVLTLTVLVGLVLPVVAGVVALRKPDPGRRGFGLGLLVGWALSTVVVVGGLVLIFSYVIRHAG